MTQKIVSILPSKWRELPSLLASNNCGNNRIKHIIPPLKPVRIDFLTMINRPKQVMMNHKLREY